MANKTVCIDEVKGCEGNCITMNDYRVAGPKPWGGGIVVKNWVASVDDVIMALRDNDVVKVVRCKDCAFYTYEGVGSSTLKRFGRCAKWYPFGNEQHSCHDDDFCSYGERREGE